MLHVVLKKSVWFFFSFLLFCSLVRNENTKRPGLYNLQVTRVPQLGRLDKIKNTCQYCDLLELWSAWVGDPSSYKKPYCDYVSFRFLWLFSNTAVPKVVSQSTCMMHPFPTWFMECMMHAILNKPFYTRHIKLGK